MAFNLQSTPFQAQDNFYSLIEVLKSQNALPQDCFIENLPFFKFDPISKESQVFELFNGIQNQQLYKELLKGLSPPVENVQGESSSSSPMRTMMTFAQLCLYKVLPCPNQRCHNRPREIVTHNQYKDSEYECPFYHHERDRRRIVLAFNQEEDFSYKANYFEEGRSGDDKEKYSQNYFESMFHPLYYKMFQCKRESCNSSQYCPFYHSEQEKKSWDEAFNTYLKKGRITYVKDKQKYYESTSQAQNNGASRYHNSSSAGKLQSWGSGKKKRYQRSPNSAGEKNQSYSVETETQIGDKINQFKIQNNNVAWIKNGNYLANLNKTPSPVFGTNKQMVANRV